MQAHKVQGEVGADMEVHVKESSRKLSLAWQCVQIKQDFYSMPWSKPFLSESGQIEVFNDSELLARTCSAGVWTAPRNQRSCRSIADIREAKQSYEDS